MMADENEEHEEEDEFHDDLGLFRADGQFEVMCDELHDDLGGFMDDHIASVVLVGNLGECGGATERTRMKALVRAYQSSALGSDDLFAFWSHTGDDHGWSRPRQNSAATKLFRFYCSEVRREAEAVC